MCKNIPTITTKEVDKKFLLLNEIFYLASVLLPFLENLISSVSI